MFLFGFFFMDFRLPWLSQAVTRGSFWVHLGGQDHILGSCGGSSGASWVSYPLKEYIYIYIYILEIKARQRRAKRNLNTIVFG